MKDCCITALAPAQGETVSLASEALETFLKDHTLGKGLAQAGQTPVRLDKPVTLRWQCGTPCGSYTLTWGTSHDLSDACTQTASGCILELSGLLTDCTYYWQVAAHTDDGDITSELFSFRTAATPRILDLEGAANARDLGGYLTADGKHRVAQGKIYRGSRLENLTPDGLSKALEVYGIRTDLDLRNPTDPGFTGDSSPLGSSVNYINTVGVQYASIFKVPEKFLKELLVFADPANYPVYIHCAAGRDRTGTLFFLLGALLGIPEKDLLADYELTYLSEYSYPAGDTTGHDWFMAFWDRLNSFPGANLQEKAEACCKHLGLTDSQIDTIRAVMLEGAR